MAWIALVVPGVTASVVAAEPAMAQEASHASPAQATQPEHAAAAAEPASQEAAAHAEQAAEHGEGEAHEGESLWATLARLLNFAILVGGLGYLLKRPLANFLEHRSAQINRDLVEAEQLRANAGEQIVQIDQKLQALPGEIEALKARGAAEIAAEEARIRATAEAERTRLVEQSRREIDQQVRVARQELLKEAADLAVGAAADRVRRHLTPEGQMRLVDWYAEQMKDAGRTEKR